MRPCHADDATSHFETVSLDCLDLYKRYAGKDLVLVVSAFGISHDTNRVGG
jgi:RAB protein geranylgeranyltransferase component A